MRTMMAILLAATLLQAQDKPAETVKPEPREAVLIPVFEPILNPIWVMIFFGEKPGSLALLGGLIVVGAITLRATLSIRKRAT